MPNYRKQIGTEYENTVADILRDEGWVVYRAPGSVGPADLIAIRAGFRPMLLQVKYGVGTTWSPFPPHERKRLRIEARKAGADAVYCRWKRGASSCEVYFEEAWPSDEATRNKVDYLLDEERGCWIWQKTMTDDGYGRVSRQGRRWLAHRWYYTEAKGPIPEGLHVDHLCGVRACVNPEHLQAVTQLENNRRRPGFVRLTPKKVAAIRASDKLGVDLAEEYGVTPSCIYSIRRRVIWKDVA